MGSITEVVNTSIKINKICTSQKPYGQGIFMDGCVTEKKSLTCPCALAPGYSLQT